MTLVRKWRDGVPAQALRADERQGEGGRKGISRNGRKFRAHEWLFLLARFDVVDEIPDAGSDLGRIRRSAASKLRTPNRHLGRTVRGERRSILQHARNILPRKRSAVSPRKGREVRRSAIRGRDRSRPFQIRSMTNSTMPSIKRGTGRHIRRFGRVAGFFLLCSGQHSGQRGSREQEKNATDSRKPGSLHSSVKRSSAHTAVRRVTGSCDFEA